MSKRGSKKGYSVGDEIRAKWPGSSLWFQAKVLEIDGENLAIKFVDGTEEKVKAKDVYREAAFLSRSRSKSPRRRSSSRSPGRRKASPGRQRKASQSPARQQKASQSPARQQKASQSPARQQKASRSPARQQKHTVAVAKNDTATTTAPKVEVSAETPARRSSRRTVLTTTSETRTYGTRSAVKAGKQTIDEPVETFSTKVPKTTHYDFGGPIGATFAVLVLPVAMYYLYFTCGKKECKLSLKPNFSRNWRDYYDQEAYLILLGWMAFQAILYMLPVGRVCHGQQLKNGNRLTYRLNGFFAFIVSLLVFSWLVYKGYAVSKIYDKFLPLMTASILLSYILAVLLYAKSLFVPNNRLAPGGNSRCTIYDFFIGHELNPRIGSFDLKFFCELRPGLIGWVMINLCFLMKGLEKSSTMEILPLLILVGFQVLYVADALWFEDAILTTMDITSDGYGFMLAFGDLAWVPFVYSLQGRYLVDHNLQIAYRNYYLAAVIGLEIIGYYIFRASNLQKNLFRQNPNNPMLKDLETIQTPSKKLLVGGWWGWVQHPNYLGDILMAFAWSLCCGFQTSVVYFYPLYLIGLLVNRQRRDAYYCHQKYGNTWDKYTQQVPYRIFPKMY